MVSETQQTPGHILAEAREYGEYLAEMLTVSRFSDAEKATWAALVPQMTVEQLQKFDEILRKHVRAQSAHELEDVLVAIKAAQQQRDLSLAALRQETYVALDKIQKEIEAAK